MGADDARRRGGFRARASGIVGAGEVRGMVWRGGVDMGGQACARTRGSPTRVVVHRGSPGVRLAFLHVLLQRALRLACEERGSVPRAEGGGLAPVSP